MYCFSFRITFFIFILLILICCYLYGKNKEIQHNGSQITNSNRNNDRDNNINSERNNNDILYSRNFNTQRSSQNFNITYEKKLSDEFVKLMNILKEKELCSVCKQNSGKYLCDCRCIVCQKHSNLKTVKKNKKEYKICFNRGKLIENLSLISNKCNICFQEVDEICNFKCGCAFKVCEECYIKSKKSSKRCPGCRRNI